MEETQSVKECEGRTERKGETGAGAGGVAVSGRDSSGRKEVKEEKEEGEVRGLQQTGRPRSVRPPPPTLEGTLPSFDWPCPLPPLLMFPFFLATTQCLSRFLGRVGISLTEEEANE